MSRTLSSLPLPEEALALHLRLCDADPTAPAEVCRAYLVPISQWLEATFPEADAHLRQTAAHDAFMNYLQNPHTYDPGRGDLGKFLRMSARWDLLNLLKQEERHHRQRVCWSAVEDDVGGGNLLGREPNPAVEAVHDEEIGRWRAYLEALTAGFTPEERRALELLLTGERREAAYAEAVGVATLSAEERKQEVKRVKDRIKARLKRGGRADE